MYSGLFFLEHPMHVSITNIEYKQDKKCFDISVKIFTNDLEDAILKKDGKRLMLGQKDEVQNSAEAVCSYILDHFSISVDKKEISKKKMLFKEKKINDGAIWVYYELSGIEKASSISIKNSILMDIYSDQTNMVIFSFNDTEKGFMFKSAGEIQTIDF